MKSKDKSPKHGVLDHQNAHLKSNEVNSSDNDNKKKSSSKKVLIALQGGGSHGAFAWGVLDALLEHENIEIVGLSGTSAGAMNAACVVQGLIQNGKIGARETLNKYWHGVVNLCKYTPHLMKSFDAMAPNSFNLDTNPFYMMGRYFENFFSPYDFNPLDYNPFLDFLKKFFRFDLIRNENYYKLYLAATHVKTGKIKIFKNEDFCPTVLMASGCLPFIFKAVNINGEDYWDGGYSANPAIYPLMENKEIRDIIIIQLTRSRCEEIPKTKPDIHDRLKEITYNATLLRELRAIYFVSKLIDDNKLKEDDDIKRLNIHLIKNEETFKNLNLSSALNVDQKFIEHMYKSGYKTGKKWLDENFDLINTKQSATQLKQILNDFIDG